MASLSDVWVLSAQARKTSKCYQSCGKLALEAGQPKDLPAVLILSVKVVFMTEQNIPRSTVGGALSRQHL